MEDSTRARVAVIVGAAFNNKKVSSLYDYNMSGHKNISVEVKNGKVSEYDYNTSSHFSGGS